MVALGYLLHAIELWRLHRGLRGSRGHSTKLLRLHKVGVLRRIHAAAIRLRWRHMGSRVRASGREGARRGRSHTSALLVIVLHNRRLRDIRRRSLLKMLVGRRVLRELRITISRSLITWKWLVRGLGSRARHATRCWPWRHGHAIFWPCSLGWNHLIWIVEAWGSIPRHAIVEHALELGWILGSRGAMKESSRGIYSGWMEGAIILARNIRGVGKPGIHVERFCQPIYLGRVSM